MDFKEKEDLIQALYDIGGCEAEDEWARGYDDGVNAAIEVVKELKIQGKVVLPKTADDFIKEGEGIGSDKVDIIDQQFLSQEQCQMMNFLCGLSRIEIYLLMH